MEKIIFTDRYDGNYPDLNTMCKGDCEGMGVVPVKKDDEEYAEKWIEREAKHHSKDGWHFVSCNQCNGTGKDNPVTKT